MKRILTGIMALGLMVLATGALAFDTETAKAPASIGDISVVITDYVDTETTDTVQFSIQVKQPDGSMFRVVTGNLIPQMTAGQITALQDFMAAIRVKATAELIP